MAPLIGMFGGGSNRNFGFGRSAAASILYQFTSHIFTNAGAAGSNGPSLSQCRSAYSSTSWTQNSSFFNMTINGVQEWTVPENGNYRIEAQGATGGNQNQTARYVGSPARIRGDFALTKGEKIKILVGQRGFLGSQRPGWGGGGGTFVSTQNNSPLIVAGGAGSTHDSSTAGSNISARTDQNSNHGLSRGGVFSSDPGYSAALGDGGSGAGFYGNGTIGNGSTYQSPPCSTPTIPQSFTNGGVGSCNGGGFGGGGNVTNTYGGGGGGYTGGGGGGPGDPYTGGGGGSYNSGSNQSNSLPFSFSNTTMYDGYVTITKL
jgi:hypothetical protein